MANSHRKTKVSEPNLKSNGLCKHCLKSFLHHQELCSIAIPSLVKYIFDIERIEFQRLGVSQQPGKRYIL